MRERHAFGPFAWWPDRGAGWHLEIGPVSLAWESRYYRTTGLQLWLGNDRMYLLWAYEPSAEKRRETDLRNEEAMKHPSHGVVEEKE